MASLFNPYGDLAGGMWLRGNLHTHSTRSDGARPPQAVIDDYAARGYDFLMMSDHDVHTSESDYAALDAKGLILIPGNEISRNGPHLLHVDADRWIEPALSRQKILNDILAAARESGRGFAIVNHPDWQSEFDHCSIGQMREWIGYVGMEIYNGVITFLDGSPYATNKWDMLLSEGRKIWGFANDDSHRDLHVELGWNVVHVRERTCKAVVEAMREGRFYASTGVVIRSLRVEGMRIRVETENAQRISAIQNVGKRLATVDAAVMEIDVPERATYVRFQCWGAGERMAWTQPFFVNLDGGGDGAPGNPFIPLWHVSPLLEEETLDTASPQNATRYARTPVRSVTSKDAGLFGFVDLRAQIRGQGGVVYSSAEIVADADGRGTLYFGYDGPVRIWLNGQQLFYGPGTNPAVVDALALHAPFQRGPNRLVVALDSNKGRAWGFFGRAKL